LSPSSLSTTDRGIELPRGRACRSRAYLNLPPFEGELDGQFERPARFERVQRTLLSAQEAAQAMRRMGLRLDRDGIDRERAGLRSAARSRSRSTRAG
jgi:hypothetical protein